MALNTWSVHDPLPVLSALPELRVEVSSNTSLLESLCQLDRHEIEQRLSTANQPYVAYMGEIPVAYGWVAMQRVAIGELELSGNLPPASRYLWDFKTLPDWRGWGIYPHLLQQILQHEAINARDFWIINAPENNASGRGITKAGFMPVGELSYRKANKAIGLFSSGQSNYAINRAIKGAMLLDVPLVNGASSKDVAPCWHCVIARRADGLSADPLCWSFACECGAQNNTASSVNVRLS
jgi:GNAT superfamily N-acetyltransferase